MAGFHYCSFLDHYYTPFLMCCSDYDLHHSQASERQAHSAFWSVWLLPGGKFLLHTQVALHTQVEANFVLSKRLLASAMSDVQNCPTPVDCPPHCLQACLGVEKAVLLTGTTGVGKSVIISGALEKLRGTRAVVPYNVNFSAQTQALDTQVCP